MAGSRIASKAPPAAPDDSLAYAARADQKDGNYFKVQPQPQPPAAAPSSMAQNKVRANPVPSTSETVEVTSEAPVLQTENANTAQVTNLGPAKWRVHRDHVQRSFDGGANWNDVPIAKGVAFNAAAAAGNQVWAAGSGAVLYHSTDGGLTWSVQWSYARDAVAKAPYRYPAAPARIYKLEISDALNGGFWVKVGGSSPQEFLFTSNDGGKHWYEETID